MDMVWESSFEAELAARVRGRARLRTPVGAIARRRHVRHRHVAIYLQDDANDTQALTVRPGSHADKAVATDKRALEKLRMQPLHPRKGDHVVGFDSRLSHRGQGREYANFERALHGREQRMVLSFSYGRKNAFSESHRRSFAMRNELVLNESLCRGAISGRCAQRAVLQDVRRRPLSWKAAQHALPR